MDLDGLKKKKKSAELFLKKIQHSDDKTKKRWFLMISAISFVIVVSLWVVYLNSQIKSYSVSEEEVEIPNIVQKDDSPSVTETFGKGFQNIKDELIDKFKKIGGDINNSFSSLKVRVEETNEINVESGGPEFTNNNVEKVATTTLP